MALIRLWMLRLICAFVVCIWRKTGFLMTRLKWDIYEPPHVKTKKMTVCPAKTQISLGIHPSDQSLCCPHKKALVLSYLLSAQRRLWSDWVDAQAGLSLHWVHIHFVGFVMRRLKWDLYKQGRPDQMPQNVVTDQGLHCLLTRISILNKIKMKMCTRHPLDYKWTHLNGNDGRVEEEWKS